LQLLISAASEVAKERGVTDVVDELSALILNSGRTAVGEMQFKVWPSRRDRPAFVGVMDPKAERGDGKEGISGAWWFFRERIKQWLDDDGEADLQRQVERLRALQVCLDSLLYVVSINLDETDNAQVIFETLNARGTGLGALDLVKNRAVADRQWIGGGSAPARTQRPAFQKGEAVGIEEGAAIGRKPHGIVLDPAMHRPEGGEQPAPGIIALTQHILAGLVGQLVELRPKRGDRIRPVVERVGRQELVLLDRPELEDTVLVTEAGSERLTDFPYDEQLSQWIG
jgi:hypothetical protein